MKIGPLSVTFHRTVRVVEGRVPANLPPSLGHIRTFEVKDYRERCPELWEDAGIFIGLHDTEALWMSFHASQPVALLVGAGSINAINGQLLGTKLETGNYVVTPPQPWLDGWKAEDGTVYQFVATPHEKGKGKTVAEQLIGDKSKTGGIGLALFEPKEPLAGIHKPDEGYGFDPYGDYGMPMASPGPTYDSAFSNTSSEWVGTGKMKSRLSAAGVARAAAAPRRQSFREMGLGKGGKIRQKVYSDPYGLDKWKELPSQTRAIYIVHAELLAEITGQTIQKPVTQEQYGGAWFGLNDQEKSDVKGTDAFTGLKSVFAEETEPAKK